MPHRYNSLADPTDPEDADDERSFSDPDDPDFPRRRSPRRRPTPLFPGQDVRPTSRKELMGWYSYAWAAEVFVVCGVGSFIPVTLEQLARENGVLLSDETVRCVDQGLEAGASIMEGAGKQCVVYILGSRINTASFAMYTFSISVFLQSLIIVSMSGAADHGAYRKRLLLAFAMMGSLATMLFITVTPGVYLMSALWAIIGNIGFGASFVLLNAFLPVLVRHHPKLLYGNSSPRSSVGTPDSTEGHSLLTNTESAESISRNSSVLNRPKEKDGPALALSTQISSYGIAIGYGAAVLLQIFSIMLVMFTGSTTRSLELVLFCIGLWWLVFTIPAALWLRPRPGPPLPTLPKPGQISGDRSSWGYIKYAWVGLGKTIMRARRLKDVMLFLAAWFLVSDGVATVSGTAVLFAKTNLGMKPPAVALISVISTVMGVAGAFAWPRIATIFNRSPSQTILICIVVFLSIPLYALLGFIPAVQRAGIAGLTNPWEMYMLGGVYGFVLGGISGYCRSVFGELIPPGSEAAFYALYAVTDKGSSIFGPTIVGAITDKYGDIRVAFWFLAVLLATPIPLIWCVDVSRGRREGRALAAEELKIAIAAANGVTHEDEIDPER
ncbi:autophagy-related protein 22-like protein [Geopyxis carbonaria]|nr:autophagy-related protein 22-like protein [Geopyxis carbonaria]